MIWVWVVLVVVVVGAVAVVAAGRDVAMAEVYEDRPDNVVPAERPLTAGDIDAVRFTTAVRGYRMDEVDVLLDRVRDELAARERSAQPDGVPDARQDGDAAHRTPTSPEPPTWEPESAGDPYAVRGSAPYADHPEERHRRPREPEAAPSDAGEPVPAEPRAVRPAHRAFAGEATPGPTDER